MINKIQEDALKETTEKERFDMLKAQDKEIHLRDQEIKRLQKRVDELEKNSDSFQKKEGTIECDKWKSFPQNSYLNDPEKVKVAIDGYNNHIKSNNATIEDVGRTSIGLNGWYEDTIKLSKKTLVEKMKDIKDGLTLSPDEEINEEINEEIKEEKVEEDKVEEDKVEEGGDEESEEEDELEVEIITHYKKDYFIKTNEKNPQYIYAIEDNDIGEKVGEMKGKKKIFYKKK